MGGTATRRQIGDEGVDRLALVRREGGDVHQRRHVRILPAEQAEFLADSQAPWGEEALSGAVAEPAWRTRPSWYLVATDDRMIPPPAQRAMAERAGARVVEVAGSHSVYVSRPAEVAALIRRAAGH